MLRPPSRRSTCHHAPRLPSGPAAQEVFDQLSAIGIDIPDVFEVLESEGVEKFETSWTELLEATQTRLEAASK